MFAYVFSWGAIVRRTFSLFLTFMLKQQLHCLSCVQCEEEYLNIWNMKHTATTTTKPKRIKDGREKRVTQHKTHIRLSPFLVHARTLGLSTLLRSLYNVHVSRVCVCVCHGFVFACVFLADWFIWKENELRPICIRRHKIRRIHGYKSFNDDDSPNTLNWKFDVWAKAMPMPNLCSFMSEQTKPCLDEWEAIQNWMGILLDNRCK